MLRRTALPLLRQHSFAAPARLILSSSRIRTYVKSKKPDDYSVPSNAFRREWQKQESDRSQHASFTPLRSVKASPDENIKPQTTERSSSRSSSSADSTAKPDDPNSHLKDARTRNSRSSASSTQSPTGGSIINNEIDPVQQNDEKFQRPLPDLTKGIPSTLEAELSQAHKGNKKLADKMNITEDPESPPPGKDGKGGELPRSAYISSSDRRRSTVVRIIYLALVVGGSSYLLYLGRNWDTEEELAQHQQAPNGYSPSAIYGRMGARLGTTVSYYSDPVTTKLLPDEDPDPNMRMPFVLVLSLEDLLVHSEWSRQTGYRIAKRPGVDYFLRYLSLHYELVLFTSQPSYIADQILRKLDPFSIIRWPLFREHTLYKDGGYVKDISYLNRPLQKVIMIDTDAHHVKNQPENAIVIPKWNGDPKDQTLIQLIPFLEYLATMGFADTRTVLKSFEGKYIPAEFARREKLLRDKFEKEQAEKKGNRGKGLGLGSLLGAKQQPQGALSTSEGSAEGKMIWDQIREVSQKNYEALEKKIQEEGAQWLADREAEEKKAQEEFSSSMRSGMFGWFGNNKGTTNGDRKS